MSTEDKKEKKINWKEIKKEITNEDGSINEDVLSLDKISYMQEQAIGNMQAEIDTYSMHATKSTGMLQLTVAIITATMVYVFGNKEIINETYRLIPFVVLIAGFFVSTYFFWKVIKLKKIHKPYYSLESYFVEVEGEVIKGVVYKEHILPIKIEDAIGLHESTSEVVKVNRKNAKYIKRGFTAFIITPLISALIWVLFYFVL